VAGIAVGLKAATMRIDVARRTLVEGQANVPRDLLFTAQRLVALFAGHSDVCSGEREFGLRMVESPRSFPLIQSVTAQTVLPQLGAMRVRVTGEAIARETKESAVQVLALDGSALRLRNVARIVALLARKLRVLSLEDVSRSAVVESLLRRFPMYQEEVLAVVLGMTGNAVPIRARRADDCSMVAAPQG
jgi:hypothetical protein